MKYIAAILTFLAGFVGFVLLHVAMDWSIGGFKSNLLFALVFAATIAVYKILDKPKDKRFDLGKTEMKEFSKVLTEDYLKESNIEGVLVKSKDDETYQLFVKMSSYNELNQTDLIERLSKKFYEHISFELFEYTGETPLKEAKGFVITI